MSGVLAGNKVVFEAQKKRELQGHYDRIKNMKSSIDTSRPESMDLPHMKRNYKKEFMDEERRVEIERENKIQKDRCTDDRYRTPLRAFGINWRYNRLLALC